MRRKPVLGETLYSLNVGDAARHRPQALTPVKVLKVGRKYFSIAAIGDEHRQHLHTEFHLKDWKQRTDYCADEALYETEQEWLNEKESITLMEVIGKTFKDGRWTSLDRRPSLDQLRRINAILEEKC